MFKDYFKLHLIVFIFGFTAILGVLIHIPAVEIVLYRTLIATLGMGIVIYWQKQGSFNVPYKDILGMLGIGVLVAAHWILFFASAKISNVSVCLVGLATATLWTALLEPLFMHKQIKWYELLLGVLVILGLYVISNFALDYLWGLILSIISAFLAALFSVLNGKMIQKQSPHTMTFYEMLGAHIGILLFLPIYAQSDFLTDSQGLQLIPSLTDWIWLLVLGLLCTVYAYTVMVELLRRMSVFAVNLSINLEPVYGILLAAIFFQEHKELNAGFYWGALVVLASVLVYPLLKNCDKKLANKSKKRHKNDLK